jgi:periplasmic copper chaperone A
MRRVLLMLLCAMLVACGQSEPRGAELREPPFAHATPVGAEVAAVYLKLSVAEADTLMSVTTPIADRIEMHSSSEENGMMKMRPMQRVSLEAGKVFSFEPGGAHLMLIGLRQPLVAGMKFPLTLKFDRSGELMTQVAVIELGSH